MTNPAWLWHCRDRALRIAATRPLIMGVLNVTPDSFSDGGRFSEPGAAVAHGLQMAADGADLLDIGGESTRPGAAEVPADEEIRRVVPVVRELARQTRAVLSVDTRKARVAAEALAAGAHVINDVSALGHDATMASVARDAAAGVILMHMRGEPATMQADPRYDDVVAEVRAYLQGRLAFAAGQGLAADRLAVDPGIGFGKTAAHNLRLIARLPAFAACGRPVVVGLSRKRFIGAVTGRERPEQRLAGSLAALVYSALRGAQVLRVHDVRASVDAVRLVAALRAEEEETPC